MSGDILAFINAQLDADEQKAQAATPGPWRTEVEHGSATVNGPDALQDGGYDSATRSRRQVMRPRVVIPPDCDYGPTVGLADAEHIIRHDPARVLRQVAAVRRIVAHCAGRLRDGEESADAETDGMVSLVLRLMAAVYADGDGYRSEWAPPA